jgi:hypothetical protein
MADISCNLPLPLLKRLEEEQLATKYNPKSITTIVQEALAMYFMAKDKERYPIPAPDKIGAEDIVSNIPPEEFKGLIIPETKDKPEQDKNIKHSFSIAEGPGAVGRMKLYGIDPNKVIAAKRAMRAGRDYDKELEKYFNLI